jgi:hypothetical protein
MNDKYKVMFSTINITNKRENKKISHCWNSSKISHCWNSSEISHYWNSSKISHCWNSSKDITLLEQF